MKKLMTLMIALFVAAGAYPVESAVIDLDGKTVNFTWNQTYGTIESAVDIDGNPFNTDGGFFLLKLYDANDELVKFADVFEEFKIGAIDYANGPSKRLRADFLGEEYEGIKGTRVLRDNADNGGTLRGTALNGALLYGVMFDENGNLFNDSGTTDPLGTVGFVFPATGSDEIGWTYEKKESITGAYRVVIEFHHPFREGDVGTPDATFRLYSEFESMTPIATAEFEMNVYNETQDLFYECLVAALADAEDHDEIWLLDDITVEADNPITITKQLGINGNGNTLTVKEKEIKIDITAKDAGINDVVTINDITIITQDPTDIRSIFVNNGKLIADNVTIVHDSQTTNGAPVGITVHHGAEAEVTNCDITVKHHQWSVYGLYAGEGATLTANNNTFNLERTTGDYLYAIGITNHNPGNDVTSFPTLHVENNDHDGATYALFTMIKDWADEDQQANARTAIDYVIENNEDLPPLGLIYCMTTFNFAGYANEVLYAADGSDIGEIVGGAKPGETIRIPGGTYSGNINTTDLGGVTLYPGDSPACVSIAGNFNVTVDDVLTIDIEGNTPPCPDPDPGYTRLSIGGETNLSGIYLNIELDYLPAVDHSFIIIEQTGSDDVTGTFDQGSEIIVEYDGYEVTFSITYATNNVTLEVTDVSELPAIPLANWALYFGFILMAVFVAIRFRGRIL